MLPVPIANTITDHHGHLPYIYALPLCMIIQCACSSLVICVQSLCGHRMASCSTGSFSLISPWPEAAYNLLLSNWVGEGAFGCSLCCCTYGELASESRPVSCLHVDFLFSSCSPLCGPVSNRPRYSYINITSKVKVTRR